MREVSEPGKVESSESFKEKEVLALLPKSFSSYFGPDIDAMLETSHPWNEEESTQHTCKEIEENLSRREDQRSFFQGFCKLANLIEGGFVEGGFDSIQKERLDYLLEPILRGIREVSPDVYREALRRLIDLKIGKVQDLGYEEILNNWKKNLPS